MRYLLGLVGLLLLIVPVYAQEGDVASLALDVPVQVTVIPDGPQVLFYVNDRPGDVLSVQTRALSATTDLDTVVWVVDEHLHLLDYNDNIVLDDGTVDSNARLDQLVLASVGVYMIYVDSFNGVSEGEVELLLRRVFPRIEVDETQERVLIEADLLEDATVEVFTFYAKEGSAFTITARDLSGTLDPYVRIKTVSGEIVAVNDDHAAVDLMLDVFDSRLDLWLAPQTDTYIVEVLDFLGRAGRLEVEILPID